MATGRTGLTDSMNNFLKFYGDNHISPVDQNLHDLNRHFGQRIGLYRSLGLGPLAFKGRDVLEVAPGSGHNAIVTASLGARSLDLVEPNPSGFDKMVALFKAQSAAGASVRFFNQSLEEYPVGATYDIVLCEGLLPGLNTQDAVLPLLAHRVRPGGVLVVTCADAVSVFFETLRRYLARLMLAGQGLDLDVRDDRAAAVMMLSEAFTPHLNTLKGMSRRVEDWVWDNLLNPAATSMASSCEFSMLKGLDRLGQDFYYYGSSPVFMADWSWYKAAPLDAQSFNQCYRQSYLLQRHNLLHTHETGSIQTAQVEPLHRHCQQFSSMLEARSNAQWSTISPDQVLLDLMPVRGVLEILESTDMGQSIAALREYLQLLDVGRCPLPAAVAAMGAFGSAFGRGQQYLSMMRA